MNSGSRPCAPRYFDEASPPLSSSPPLPAIAAAARDAVAGSPPWPVSLAITCSTGPPGANWMTAKEIAMIPSIVGIISSMRRRI